MRCTPYHAHRKIGPHLAVFVEVKDLIDSPPASLKKPAMGVSEFGILRHDLIRTHLNLSPQLIVPSKLLLTQFLQSVAVTGAIELASWFRYVWVIRTVR